MSDNNLDIPQPKRVTTNSMGKMINFQTSTLNTSYKPMEFKIQSSKMQIKLPTMHTQNKLTV